jgi:hypothetical protein
VSAKFVNLIEFFECKIFTQVKTVRFTGRSVDNNMIVPGIDAIDMGPDKEFALRQSGHGDPGMVDGYIFLGIDLFLTIEQVTVNKAEEHMHASHQPPGIGKLSETNTYEEKDLGKTKEKVHPGHIGKDILAGQHQNKNIHRHQQQAAQVNRTGMWFPEMGNGMREDKASCCKMQQTA